MMTSSSPGSTAGPDRVELTDEQRAAVAHLLDFPRKVMTLGGYAGSGKSTCVQVLLEHLPNFSVVTPTGKSADVLRRKGVAGGTIHGAIYRPHERVWWDADGRRHTEVTFELKGPWEVPGDGFLVDEASMVGRKLFDDLLSFGRPIIAVGDHGQLPPVGDKDFNLLAAPDVTLETVHRHAGAIARFAEWLRKGGEPAAWPGLAEGGRSADGSVAVVKDFEGVIDHARGCPGACCVTEQVICATNRARVRMNRVFREALGFPADRPVVGDKVICLRNDRRAGVFNGMQGQIAALGPGGRMVFHADGQDYALRYVPEQLNREAPPSGRDRFGRTPFDYCYAVSCHKSQGGEWDYVTVQEQRCGGWDHSRWCYTAASRARRWLSWWRL
jgi:exodeoxyribonuclease-5